MTKFREYFTRSFLPVERIILLIVATILALDLFLIIQTGAHIDWIGYAKLSMISVGVLSVGIFYRLSGRSDRIALALISTGLFPAFSWSIIMLNYLLLPNSNPVLDQSLAWFDSQFGFDWPSLIEWAGNHPILNKIMQVIYASIVMQIAVVFFVLGLLGKAKQLHATLLTIIFTSIVGMIFWYFFPSHGTTAVFSLSPAMEAKALL